MARARKGGGRQKSAQEDAVPYDRLTPDVIIGAIETFGYECTGSILGLASYENRVYQIGVAEGFVVAKFYRPGRWSTDAILEEHDFALELAEQDIPVVAPLVRDGYSLREQEGYEEFYSRLRDFVMYVLPGYRKEMKSYLTIGIGCTGGRHRSVAIGQRLSDDLEAAGYAIETVRRDCRR